MSAPDTRAFGNTPVCLHAGLRTQRDDRPSVRRSPLASIDEAEVWSPPSGKKTDGEMSLDAIAAAMGISKERVRSIETKALNRLRHPSRSSQLKEFL